MLSFTSSIKISELDPITSATDEDFIPIVISSSLTTYRVNRLDFLPAPLQYVSGSVYSSASFWASQSMFATQSLSSTQSIHATQSLFATQSIFASSASWASHSMTAASASWASQSGAAASASWASQSLTAVSASWASSSISSSYARSASWAPTPAPSDTVPIGTVITLAYYTPVPNNFLPCTGGVVLISTFQDLYNAISASSTAAFGYRCNSLGIPSTTDAYFKLPDFRGEFLRGWDNGRGLDLGRAFGTDQACQVQYHKHISPWNPYSLPYHIAGIFGEGPNLNNAGIFPQIITYGCANCFTNDGSSYNGAVTNTTGVMGTETRPVNIAVMHVIKYSNAANYVDLTGYTIAGDVIGNLTDTVVVGIQGIPVSAAAPTSGQVLEYIGSQWVPTDSAGGSTTGMVAAFATPNAPSGWLKCNGDLFFISAYPSLAAAIWVGPTLNLTADYGYKINALAQRDITGIYMKLPDLRGAFIRGFSSGSSSPYDPSRPWASNQAGTLGNHTHTVTYNQPTYYSTGMAGSPTTHNLTELSTATTVGTSNPVANSGVVGAGGAGTETVPVNVTLMYCIKT